MERPVSAAAVLLSVAILICGAATVEGGVLTPTKRNTELSEESDSGGNANSYPHLEVLRGRDGRDGEDGLPGPAGQDGKDGKDGRDGRDGKDGEKGEGETLASKAHLDLLDLLAPCSSGGVVYTRWGRTTCPDTPGTELVYAGRAGGTHYTHKGGAADYLCMPESPEYLSFTPGHQGGSPVYGVEYETGGDYPGPLASVDEHNVPCSVCSTTARVMVLMLPAKTQCPPSWTLEYNGYLMTAHNTHHRTAFECMDKDPECIPGSAGNENGALFFHTEATCTGLPCPPYDTNKELTCAVCTK